MDSGIYRVKQNKDSKIYKWDYILDDGNKIQGRTLSELRSKVIILGHTWKVTNQELEKQSRNKEKSNKVIINSNYPNSPRNFNSKRNKPKKRILKTSIVSMPRNEYINETGYKFVKIDKSFNEWVYDNGNKKISRKYLWKLEEDVKNQNLEWELIDEYISNKFKKEEYEIIFSYKLPSFYKFLKENDVLNSESSNLRYIIKEYEQRNKGTGILFVTPISDKTGNNWRYKNFMDNSWFYASTLSELKNIVKNNNLEWKIINKNLFESSLKRDAKLIEKLDHEIDIQRKNTKTGLFRVSFNKCWEYNYSNNEGKCFKIQKRTISKLKNDVLNLNLPWINLNQELTRKSEIKDKKLMEIYKKEEELRKKEEEKDEIERKKKIMEVLSEDYEVKKINMDKMFR